VSALFDRPRGARAGIALAHGAGAGMRHAFMEAVSERLTSAGVAVFRYQFPYIEQGRRAPDPPGVLVATVRAAIETAAQTAPDLLLFAGGKSLGGRMTSTAAAQRALPGVRGIAFFGFPLHAPGRPGRARAEHLREVKLPLLFLQGTRDPLADLGELRPVLDDLGERAQLHVVDGGDHSFHVPRRSGRSDADVQGELCARVVKWMSEVGPTAMGPP
jgi:predicted alpha/beta-hydrolase family hydrolase